MSKSILAIVLVVALAFGGTASAQSGSLEVNLNAIRRQPAKIRLSVKAGPERAQRSWPAAGQMTPVRNSSTRPLAIGVTVGFTAGAILGYGVAGEVCHCESQTGVVVGMAVGAAAGLALAYVLTK